MSNGPLSLTEVTNIDSLAFSPDGKLIAGGTIQRIVLWDAGSGKVVRELPNESSIAAHLRFSKDGKTLTSVHDFYGVGGIRFEHCGLPNGSQVGSGDRQGTEAHAMTRPRWRESIDQKNQEVDAFARGVHLEPGNAQRR